MRILIAPDKFKGTLSAKDAATAIARGVHRAAEERGAAVDIEVCPVADGGEGFVDCVQTALGVQPLTVEICGPLCEPREGRLLMSPPRGFPDLRPRFSRRQTYMGSRHPLVNAYIERRFAKGLATCDAYFEAADAMGMRHVPPERKNPERTCTHGVGELVEWALHFNSRRQFIGLGGSATVDGGLGACSWLGVQFRDELGLDTGGASAKLSDIRSIDPLPAEHPIHAAELNVLCDVSNPLLGENGAARIYGPQKGATPEQVERLEAGLTNLVKVCRECGIPCDPDQPGAGAAGGLGFGLATFLGAKLVPGAPFVFDLLRFDERVRRADVVFTGEGQLDSQTASGKSAAEVARRAARANKRCAAVVGSTEGTSAEVRSSLAASGIHFDSVTSAVETAGSPKAAMTEPRRWLAEAAYRSAQAILSGHAAPG